jgi:hypothetical protein
MVERAEGAGRADAVAVRGASRSRVAAVLRVLIALGAAAAPAIARAEGVLDRKHPEYDPLGVPAGGFLLFPSLDLSTGYTDNLFSVENGGAGDFLFTVEPSATLQSNWNNHELALTAAGSLVRTADHATENTNAWRLAAQGRIDARRDITISLSGGVGRQAEPRSNSTGKVPTRLPTFYTQDNLAGNVVLPLNRLKLTTGISYAREIYEDTETLAGRRLPQSYRDNRVTTWMSRADYLVSPDTAIFFEAAPFTVRYVARLAAETRDHQGVRYLVGFNLAPSRLVEGEFAVGYLSETFLSPLYHPVHAPSYRVNLQWFPTELLTLSLSGNQKTTDSGLIDAPVYESNAGELGADWEFQRDIIVSSRFGYEERDFHGTDRTDRRYSYNSTMTYHLRRGVTFSLKYEHLHQSSRGGDAGPMFTDNVGTFALSLQR